jgi:hypothetical protein
LSDGVKAYFLPYVIRITPGTKTLITEKKLLFATVIHQLYFAAQVQSKGSLPSLLKGWGAWLPRLQTILKEVRTTSVSEESNIVTWLGIEKSFWESWFQTVAPAANFAVYIDKLTNQTIPALYDWIQEQAGVREEPDEANFAHEPDLEGIRKGKSIETYNNQYKQLFHDLGVASYISTMNERLDIPKAITDLNQDYIRCIEKITGEQTEAEIQTQVIGDMVGILINSTGIVGPEQEDEFKKLVIDRYTGTNPVRGTLKEILFTIEEGTRTRKKPTKFVPINWRKTPRKKKGKSTTRRRKNNTNTY